MLHAFIDESEYRTDLFFLGSLLVSDSNLDALCCALDDVMGEFSSTSPVPAGAELHGYDMMQQKHDWSGVPLRVATAVYFRAMRVIDQYAEAFYVEGIDRVKQAERYTKPYNHRTVAIGYILERVQEHATRLNDHAVAYLDDHYTAPEGRKEFIQYKSLGTFGYRSSKLDLVDEMDFYDSRDLRGLQAADLCTYIYKRIITCRDTNPRAVRIQESLWSSISSVRARGRCRIWP